MKSHDIARIVSAEIVISKEEVAKPQVLVLVGLQYAGKSYLAERIVSKNYAHFGATKIKKRYDIKNPEMIEVATSVISIVANDHFNLAIDFVNHKYEMRRRLQEAAKQSGADYKVVFLDTPKPVRLERREKNIESGEFNGRRIISIEQMEQFEQDFERPTTSESLVTLKDQQDIDCFIHSL